MTRLNRQAISLALLPLALAACTAHGGAPPGAEAPAPAPTFLFVNGDFEADAIGATPPSGWTLQNYLNTVGVSGTASAPPATFAALNLTGLGTAVNETYTVGGATSSQIDPDLGPGQSFRYPAYGQRSARVNYKDAATFGKNKNANVIRQSMTVGLGDLDPVDGQIHVRFAVAPVLENPAHSFNQQPYYYLELQNVTRGTVLYSAFNVAGQAGVPWHTTTSLATGNAVQWLDWQLFDIAPGGAALASGDVVQLTAVGSGCTPGGHFGRVYVDGMGASIPGPFVGASAPGSVNSGATLQYAVSYHNGSSVEAIGSHFDMVTPPGTTFASIAGITGCTTPAAGSAGTIACPLGTLAGGASGSFTVTVNVTATSGSIVNGNYSVGAVNAATLLGAKVTTTVVGGGTPTADLVVTKTSPVTTVQPGGDFTTTALYTITVTNTSTTTQIRPSIGTSVTLTDVVPAALTNVTWACTMTRAGATDVAGSTTPTKCRADAAAGVTGFNGTGNTISLSPRLGYDSGAGGGQIQILVRGTIAAGATGTLVNTATLSAPSGVTDPNLQNNTATVSLPVGAPQTLTLTKAGGAANGTVGSAPAGLSCGTACTTASATFVTGSQVVLTASPAAGATFTGWSGAVPAGCTGSPAPTSCTLTISAATAVTATFAPPAAAGAAAAIYVYSGNDQPARTSTAFGANLAALVTDAAGRPVSGATVTFTAVPVGGASATLGGGTAVTSSAGVASVAATANATPGTYTVNATVAGVASPAIFTLTNVGPPASITYVNGGSLADPQVTPVSTGFAARLMAVVKDAAGNVIPGVTVTYTVVPVGGASAVLTGATSGASVTTTTDASGLSSVTAVANATASPTAGTVVTPYTVTASVAGLATPATFYLENITATPAAIFIVSGNPQTASSTAAPLVAFAQPLVVVVADGAGNALQGVTVTWAAQPVGGATATLTGSTGATTESGTTSITATPNATGGTYTVTASVAGVATPATFTLTNDGGSSLTVQAGSPQSTGVGQVFATQLQAVVRNGAGTAVQNAVVTFRAPTSGATATLSGGNPCVPAATGCRTATTNAAGVASLTATASAVAGSYVVTASTPTAPTSAAFSLSNRCSADAQCGGTAPICNTGSGTCQPCGGNAQCSTKDASKPSCDGTGACFGCLSDAQCSGTTPICSQASNACAACTTDSQCSGKDAANPYCRATGACFAGYTITASAGANGTITPSGTQTVAPGGAASYGMAGSTGYHVAGVLVDGASVGAVTSHTFSNLAADHTIAASFAVDQFTVTGSSGGNGTVSCTSPVDYATSSTCTITPAAGYVLATLTDDGTNVLGSVVGGSYVIGNVTAAHAVAATFVKALGTACTLGAECQSGTCADSVCCDSACSGQCQACNLPGKAGTCSPVTGAPVVGRTACATDGSSCGGACDGTNVAACAYPTSSCRAASCTAGTATLAASCDGAGACPAVQTQACTPYVCGPTACRTSCTADADCISGDYCSSGACTPTVAIGGSCSSGNQCGSGACADGVCCGSACGGQCEACNLPGTVGTCSPVTGAPVGGRAACASDGSACGGACNGANVLACTYPTSSCRAASCTAGTATLAASCDGAGACPAAQTQACTPYVCGPTACRTSCTGNADCVPGDRCSSGACVPSLPIGAGCTESDQCGSGACADGVCCGSACGGQCEACNLLGTVGTCSPVTGAPVGGRTACATDGSACGGACDGTNVAACAYPTAACRAATCSAGTATLAASCNGAGACPAAQTQACTPYVCGATACRTSCTTDAECISGDSCSSGACTPKAAIGESCTTAGQCGSGACVDGVCCGSACAGQCQACNVPGSLGTCSPVTGAPVGGRAACATDGSACGGACDGIDVAACAYPSSATSCRAASCTGGTATLAAACNGAGACPAAQTQACTPYLCGPTACLGNCTVSTDCVPGDFCSGGVCTPGKPNGTTCSEAGQCASGHCTDGVCCGAACGGQCQACNLAGLEGTCSTVVGAPVGGRPACASDGSACGGACDGSLDTACTYPTTSCRAPSCADGTATLTASCDGAGACPAVQTQACAPYLCGPTACQGNCTADAECASGKFCSGGICAPTQPPGATCAGDTQCASAHCVDGVCCDTACTGQCQACNLAARVGTCSMVIGAPAGARPACADDQSGCGGACDGGSATACTYPTTECRAASCASGIATLAASCDGAGACPARQAQACAPNACGATTCQGGCTTTGDCATGAYCAGGVCTPTLGDGSTCSGDDQCGSGHCVDGLCCNSDCSGQCEACDVDGHRGACTAVAGPPHAGRATCATDGSSCAGACDGSTRTACTYPGSATTCSPGTCTAGVDTPPGACDGAGSCHERPSAGCGAYACDGAACATSCEGDGQCGAGNVCRDHACVPSGSTVGLRVSGSGGCASTGDATLAPLAALALLLLLRRRRVGAGVLEGARSDGTGAGRAALLVLLLGLAAPARAQTVSSIEVQRFRPLGGASDLLGVPSADVPGHLAMRAGLYLDHADQPLQITDGTSTVLLVRRATGLVAGASLGLFGRAELALAVPLVLSTSGQPASTLSPGLALDSPSAGLGDLRLTPKVRLHVAGALTLSGAVTLSLPTATATYAGQEGVTVTPRALAEYRGSGGWRVAADAGVLIRGSHRYVNVAQQTAAVAGLAGEVPLTGRWSALATLTSELGTGAVERPVELLAAVQWRSASGLTVTGGGGPGLTSGYGTPRFRLLAGVAMDLGGRRAAELAGPPAPPPPVMVAAAPAPPPAPPAPPAPPSLPEPEPPPEPPAAVAVAPPPPPPPAPVPPSKVVLQKDRIVLLDQVHFETDRDVIKPESRDVLAQVTTVLRENPQLRLVRIEGHTDTQGGAAHNLDLSRRRAQQVRRALMASGIAGNRLEAEGYGQTRPVTSNDTAKGRASNRRVEFVIVTQE